MTTGRLQTGSFGSRVTIVQVAERAGVALGTASKALNGRGQLRPETRERVLAAARELGFEPNALAQSLVRGRTYSVGLITSDSFGRFSIPLMMGIEDALSAGQLSVFLCDARGDAVREQHYLRTLLARRVDGLIVSGRRTDPRQPISAEPLPVPVVYAYTQSTRPEDLSLLPDDAQGGRLAAEHLLQMGRRRIAHITGPTRFLAVREREQGLRDVLAAAGLELPDSLVLAGAWSEAWGREAVELLFETGFNVDGIFCGSDQIARGVADALRDHGVAVPDDVALVGFDNWEIIAAETRPPLTTIDMSLDVLGRSAAEQLLAMVGGEPRSGLERFPCRLVVRESSGKATLREPTPPQPHGGR